MDKLELWFPVKPLHINQGFGVNGQYYAKFGINGHNGIDFMATHGQPVYATHDGTAYWESDVNGGEGVVIVSDKMSKDINGRSSYWKTIYWHLCDGNKEPQFASPIWRNSQPTAVRLGDVIGYADNTGAPNESSGDHLHYGLKPITTGTAPTQGDAPDVGIGSWVNLDQNNGFLGAVDPTPYFNNYFAQDSGFVVNTMLSIIALLHKVVGLLSQSSPQTSKT